MIFFNSSMPRSGSELLQVLLHQNPDIYASTTSPLLEYQYAARLNYELPEVKSQDPEIMLKAFIAMCKGMANSYYSTITDRKHICDKNRGWSHYYEWVEQWNPSPKMICMVRDLRSVIASMERIYRKNRHRPTGPDNPAEIQNMTCFDRVNYWLSKPPVGMSLARTLDCIQRKVDKSLLFIRYEDLCADPTTELKKIYNYIEIPFYENHYFTNIKKEVYEDCEHFGVYGNHNIKPDIKPVKPSDWSDVLEPGIAGHIRERIKWYFDYFNY